MGLDAKKGRFPICPEMSRFCFRLSSFVLLGARNGDKSGQKRTDGDKIRAILSAGLSCY